MVIYLHWSFDRGSRGKQSFLLQPVPLLSGRGTALEGGCIQDSLLFPSCFPPADNMCCSQAWIKCHVCPQAYNCFLNATPLVNIQFCHDCVQCFPFCQHWDIGLGLSSAACSQNCYSCQMQRFGAVSPLYSSTQRYGETWGERAVLVLYTSETTAYKKRTNKCSVVWSKPVSSVERGWENQKVCNLNKWPSF